MKRSTISRPDDFEQALERVAAGQAVRRSFVDEGLSVVVADPILLESYTLFRYRLGFASASTWPDDVRSGSTWINPSPRDYRQATSLARPFPDQPITLFDATLGHPRIAADPVSTHDHHFDTMVSSISR